ncbi:NADH:flavin oxidoreductase [Myxococcus sp. CA039A]|uniref:NADH:flavin oxidoreductase n=1 Tax=Myxococcus sp. CA039A TaxID=2741737 RepID=UPI00157B15CF|nr:NADH:flavin oxidoreductase [Myxococcus sp. CA039A]NTX55051.1 NADH:flavin oxidoreductase [Myxococcus sp. CA039A]
MAGLFDPLELRENVVARNRIWLAPLTNQQSHADGTLSDAELHFLSLRADGGFGLVETCAAHVEQDGKAWPGELGVHDDAMLPGLRRLAARIHQGGALLSAQLFHGGLRADPAVSGLERWSASAHTDAADRCREGTEEDIQGAIRAFANAATRCAQAGFDGVELHGAHGYLLSQFLSTVYNRREDRWGGSLENRSRLIRETVAAVRRAVPERVLAVRLSPEDFGQAKGLDLDETLEVARMLADGGMDVLHLSLWRSALNTNKRPQEHATALFRAAVPSRVKIVVAGAIWTKEDAEAQLALGADAVALGRSAIANHDWPERVRRGDAIQRPPFPGAVLRAEGASAGFVDYLRGWKNFVVP